MDLSSSEAPASEPDRLPFSFFSQAMLEAALAHTETLPRHSRDAPRTPRDALRRLSASFWEISRELLGPSWASRWPHDAHPRPTKKEKNSFQITDVVEKPKIKDAKSNYAIIGRYILPKKIMNEIKRLKPGQGKEIHITDAIKNLILKNEKFYGNIFKGKYLDCGTLNGYIKSGIEISKENK